MKELILATTNQGKLKEIKAMLKDIDIDVLSMKDVLDQEIDIEETGTTFKENALIKASTIAKIVNKPVLADDSGLEVDALDKQPGIYSSRFLGEDTSYDIKNQYIIDAIKGKERSARFVCAMALVIPDKEPIIIEETMETIMRPMAHAMVQEGVPFTGFLYGGLMLTENGVKTIEFNARFGDPEAEVILPRLKSDFVDVIQQVMAQQECKLDWSDDVTLGVVLASAGYPASSTKGAVIKGLDALDAQVYHMGTAMKDCELVTDGGRVLIVVTQAKTLEEAYAKTYAEIKKIDCDCLFYRNDIGKKDMN